MRRNYENLKEMMRVRMERFREHGILLSFDDLWDKEGLREDVINVGIEMASWNKKSALFFTTRSAKLSRNALSRVVHLEAGEATGEESRGILFRAPGRGVEDWNDGYARKQIIKFLKLCERLAIEPEAIRKGVRILS